MVADEHQTMMRTIPTTLSGAVVLGTFLAVSACAGMNHEPQSPQEQTLVAPEEPEPSTTSEPAEEAPTTPESSVEAASQEDFEQAMQVVIQDDALLSELKLTEPGRFPLKIAGKSLPSGLELQAHTEAVQVVPEPEDPKKTPVLVFTDVDLNAQSGTFHYRYDIEGVRGSSYVIKNSAGIWELKSSRVTGY